MRPGDRESQCGCRGVPVLFTAIAGGIIVSEIKYYYLK
jgi:hypothetical protein